MSAIHSEVFSGPFTGTGNALMKKGTVIMNIPTSHAMWNSGSALANWGVDGVLKFGLPYRILNREVKMH